METLHFEIIIDAPREVVWEVMLSDKSYQEWTKVFNPTGCWFEGSWEKGSTMRFLGKDEEGKLGGMISKIAENRPQEFLSIEHLGETHDGVDDTTSDRAKQWSGAHENYTFEDSNGTTTLRVDVDILPEFKTMFEDMWRSALETLKTMCAEKLKTPSH